MKKILILTVISIMCLFTACTKNEKQTAENAHTSGEAWESGSASDMTESALEESKNTPQNSSESDLVSTAPLSETTEPVKETEKQTSSSSTEADTGTEEQTDTQPLPERKVVNIDDPYAEPLMPPPETKEVLRLPNEVFLYPALADEVDVDVVFDELQWHGSLPARCSGPGRRGCGPRLRRWCGTRRPR